jgi:hypothetical protein
MPGYGKQTSGAGRGFWRASRNPESIVFDGRSGSLLAANFNASWCNALNLVHAGHELKYFAMMHDDIEPRDFWLDDLIAELEAKDLDVLGVASPIKDRKGLTSLAIDNDHGNTWRPKCRLTLREVAGLPETFTSEDVGGPLLLNTGCWVCRFDPAWVKKVHFEINDRIVFNRTTNRYEAEVEPEDWYFSRLCHELGLRIGATRKIPLSHRGEMDFTNLAWGNEFDSEYVTESQLPMPFPHEIDGWLSPEEGSALAELSRGKRVLEIGSFCGRSTVCIARTAAWVAAVDFFDGRATPKPGDTSDAFRANLVRYGVAGKVQAFLPGDDLPGPFGLAFIDGDHSQEAVEVDIAKALSVLEPGGLLAFHDYRKAPGQFDGGWDPGVNAAVDRLIAQGGELIATHHTLAVVRPPVLVPA